MKKICFMMPTAFNIGGEQRVVSSLCNALLEEGYDVSLLLFDNRFKTDYDLFNLNKKTTIYEVSGYFSFFRRVCRKIRNLNSKYGFLRFFPQINYFLIKNSFPISSVKKQLNVIKPDILVGVAGEYNLLACILKKSYKDIKMIGWQHSCHDAYFNTKGRRHYYEKKLFCKLVKKLDNYVVLSKTDKKLMKDELNIEVDYIYNIKSFSSNKKANLENHQFISAGRIENIKGFDLLVKAYALFVKNNSNTDWKLKIVGDGKEKETIINLIKENNLEDKVILPGFTKNMEEIYEESSIYVMPSRWEGFPMTLGECMEMGLPIISFDINIMKEFIDNEETGILVEKYDIEKLALAMEKLANDINLRKKISSNSKEKVKELSKETIVSNWKKILERN